MENTTQIVKEKKFISLVIYLHNSAPYLKFFLDTVIRTCENHFEQFEIVCVDDACQDNTVDLLKEYVEERKLHVMVNVVHMSFFQGLESAMNAGRDIAIGDFVYEFDDIFVDYDEKVIMDVYYKLLEGNDIVAASSKGKMRLTSKLFYALYNKTKRGNGKIGPETFRVMSRRAINRIKSMGQYIPYRKAVYANCGLKTANIRYEAADVQTPKEDRAERKYRTDLAVNSMILFTELGYRFAVTMTVLMMAVAVLVALYSAVVYLFSTPVAGWTTTIFFMSFAFFGLFGILTIIIKYLQILVDLVFRRKKYSFESIEKM